MTAEKPPLEALSQEIMKYIPVESTEVASMSENDKAFEVLRGNTFGILEESGTTEEKMVRLVLLLPMAFQMMDEARSTIARLREENENLLDERKNQT